jgi:hypothetical protein
MPCGPLYTVSGAAVQRSGTLSPHRSASPSRMERPVLTSDPHLIPVTHSVALPPPRTQTPTVLARLDGSLRGDSDSRRHSPWRCPTAVPDAGIDTSTIFAYLKCLQRDLDKLVRLEGASSPNISQMPSSSDVQLPSSPGTQTRTIGCM